MDILKAFDAYVETARKALADASTLEEVEQVRIEFLGQKKGKARELQALIGKASKEEKPVVGKRFNEVRTEVTALLEEKLGSLTAQTAETSSDFDPTLPG